MKKLFLYVLIICLCLSGCSAPEKNTITQICTIDALLVGLYDGNTSCRELLKNGNLGIGTFDDLDGEMIVLNGKVYQVKADGKVYTPDLNVETPFASICQFNADETLTLKNGMSYKKVEEFVSGTITNKNLFYAIKIFGEFEFVKTRSVPAQKKPYPPLTEVTKNQPKFLIENETGYIVGFICPPYVKGINVPGFHLHFINENFSKGGHVLDFVIRKGKCEIDICNQFLLKLPEKKEAFGRVDLSKDRSEELDKAEK